MCAQVVWKCAVLVALTVSVSPRNTALSTFESMYLEEVNQCLVKSDWLFVHGAVVGPSQQAKLGVWNLPSEIAGLVWTN